MNKLFHSSQYGFKKQHPTELAAMELVNRVTLEMEGGEIPFGIFLDLSKAFHTLNHSILLDKSNYHGNKNCLLQLINSYFAARFNPGTITLYNLPKKFTDIPSAVKYLNL